MTENIQLSQLAEYLIERLTIELDKCKKSTEQYMKLKSLFEETPLNQTPRINMETQETPDFEKRIIDAKIKLANCVLKKNLSKEKFIFTWKN